MGERRREPISIEIVAMFGVNIAIMILLLLSCGGIAILPHPSSLLVAKLLVAIVCMVSPMFMVYELIKIVSREQMEQMERLRQMEQRK